MRKAKPAAQMVVRQEYRGGWPLGFTTAACPAETPVGCRWISTYNLNCCPSGQFCFGTQQPYCCPTDDDCGPAVKNIPVCANSIWTMFHNEEVRGSYFCCPSGHIGVIPTRGESGVCERDDVDVPKSQLATTASQVGLGGTSATPFTDTTSSTLTSDGPLTRTGTGTVATAGPSGTGTGRGTQDGTGNTGSNAPISTGAIAGIAVGAAAGLAIAVALIMWWHRRSLRKRPSEGADPQNTSGQICQECPKPAAEVQTKPTVLSQPSTPTPGYGSPAPYAAYEVHATPRVEMEAPADGMRYNTAPRPM